MQKYLTALSVWTTSFCTLAMALAVSVIYIFTFELTRSSPISSLSFAGWFMIFGQSLATFAGLAFCVSIVLFPIDLLIRIISPTTRFTASNLTAFASLMSGLLVVAENHFYILFRFGLKTTESIGLEALIVAAALALSLLLAQPLLDIAKSLSKQLVVVPIAVIAFIFAWQLSSERLKMLSSSTKDGRLSKQNEMPSSSTKDGKPSKQNVVILSTDGLNADWLSMYGYSRDTTPFLSSRRHEFTVYQNAYTNNGNTTGSITSLLTGRSPFTTKVVYTPDILIGSDSFLSLPTVLGNYGFYRSNWAVPHFADAKTQNMIGAFTRNNGRSGRKRWSNILISTASLTDWLNRRIVDMQQEVVEDVLGIQEMDNAFGQVTRKKGSLSDQQRLDGLLEEISASLSPFFINTHFMETHGPDFKPKSRTFSKGRVQTKKNDPDFRDDTIRDFDSYVQKVFEALEGAGLLDRTLVIVTSDHGLNWDPLYRVPLLIRYPERMLKGTVNLPVQRLDIAPTVLDWLGIPIPSWMEGLSLLKPKAIPEDRMILSVRVWNAYNTRRGWIHKGGREIGEGHVLYGIKCGSFAQFNSSFELVKQGKISGDSSLCRAPANLVEQSRQQLQQAIAGGSR